MEFDKVAFGNRLYIARKEKELKQIDIARKLGINQPSYSSYENGKTDVSASTLFQLSKILDVSVSWLIGEYNIPHLSDSERHEMNQFEKYLLSKRIK